MAGDVLIQILIAFDQLIGTLFGGMADETISAACWRNGKTSHRWNAARIAVDTLLWFDPMHCFASYISEFERNQLPEEYYKMNTNLETLIPTPVEITVNGKTLTLHPVTMRQLQPAIRAALPILQALKSGALELEKLKAMNIMAWAEAYALYGDDLGDMVAYLMGVEPEEMAGWTPDQVVLAVSAVVRVNADFFASLARQPVAAPKTAQPQTGPSPSSV